MIICTVNDNLLSSVINENNVKEAKPCGILPEKRATTTVRDKLTEAMLAVAATCSTTAMCQSALVRRSTATALISHLQDVIRLIYTQPAERA